MTSSLEDKVEDGNIGEATLITKLRENNTREGSDRLRDQFKKIVKESSKLGKSIEFASNPDLTKKNRYRRILPYDDTRVKLIESESGYINACYINGYKKQHKYIATQGPLPETIADFWQMVFEQRSHVIIMLTTVSEYGKIKCEKYWPDLLNKQQSGSLLITNENEMDCGSFIKRTFKVESSKKNKVTDHIVHQYHYIKWPDCATPESSTGLIQMYRAAFQCQEEYNTESPVVLHCSAGSGRTGTFIGYDILLNESNSTGNFNAYLCVINMRKQRVEMVENSEQYIYIQKLLLDSILMKGQDLLINKEKKGIM